ncbi:hypothetical protein BFF78_40900 [Streptomyces fodineus]|uniref:Uncharacterized protein n=2 Tax=Streptomyces fodineus TaxID=1904616 RepID=A0A1D7YMG5_9ACTN|nr:hypothetical protein BFF78_40900 [Streptomyces fodineus]
MELSTCALTGEGRGCHARVMRRGIPGSVAHLSSVLVLAGLSAAAWTAWLGWDQQRDAHPDGSTTGPYEAWQVIGQ